MPFVGIDTVMLHCRGSEDDAALLTLYLSGAKQSAIDYLDRNVYESQIALDAAVAAGTAGDYPIVVNDAINTAILLTVGHLYANREDVIVGATASQLPNGAQFFLRPHRIFPGV